MVRVAAAFGVWLWGCSAEGVQGPPEVAPPPPSAGAAIESSAPAVASASVKVDPAAEEVVELSLDATVDAVEPVGERAGTVWAVHADPRFVLVLRIHGVAPQLADDPSAPAAGGTFSFGIHSPAKLFEGLAPKSGVRARLAVKRVRSGDVIRYEGLRLDR